MIEELQVRRGINKPIKVKTYPNGKGLIVYRNELNWIRLIEEYDFCGGDIEMFWRTLLVIQNNLPGFRKCSLDVKNLHWTIFKVDGVKERKAVFIYKYKRFIEKIRACPESILDKNFPILEVNDDSTIHIKVAEEFLFYISDINHDNAGVEGFSSFYIKDLIGLSSKYSKEALKFVAKFRTVGFWSIKITEFKLKMGLDEENLLKKAKRIIAILRSDFKRNMDKLFVKNFSIKIKITQRAIFQDGVVTVKFSPSYSKEREKDIEEKILFINGELLFDFEH